MEKVDSSEILEERQKYMKKSNGNAAQKTVAEGLSQLAITSGDKKGIDVIGATGGVFYNEAITDTVKRYVESNEYNFLQHKNTCCGDGSVSLGQAIVAKLRNI